MFRGVHGKRLGSVLDALGKCSATAQGLRKPITHGAFGLMGQRIYLAAEGSQALGFLKVGEKHLFVAPPPQLAERTRAGAQEVLREMSPVCALDFYVHESCQRSGVGLKIFQAMLEHEGLRPAQLGYDRPSKKFLAFLAKHYGLKKYQEQNNNFVVFDAFYERAAEDNATRGSRTRGACHEHEASRPLGGMVLAGSAVDGSSGIRAHGACRAYEDSEARSGARQVAAHDSVAVGPSDSRAQGASHESEVVRAHGGSLAFCPPRSESPYAARPPLLPRHALVTSDISSVSGSLQQSEGLMTCQASTKDMLQQPSHGRCPQAAGGFRDAQRFQDSSHSGPRRVSSVPADIPAAGMPSRAGETRSNQISSGRSASYDGGLGAPAGVCTSGSSAGGSSRRFASPLSHAGQNILIR